LLTIKQKEIIFHIIRNFINSKNYTIIIGLFIKFNLTTVSTPLFR